MDASTKRQLVGAAVIVALAVIFLPMLFTSPQQREQVEVPLEVPPRADRQESDREPQLVEPQNSMPDFGEQDMAAAANKGDDRDSATAAEDEDAAAGGSADVGGVPLEQGAYAVQVGSFREKDNAYGFRDRVRDMGMPAYVDQSEIGGEPAYRVRIGPVMERDRAEQMLNQASSELDVQGWVVSL